MAQDGKRLRTLRADDGPAVCAMKCGQLRVVQFAPVGLDPQIGISDQSKVQDHIGHKVTITGKVDGDTLKVESVKM